MDCFKRLNWPVVVMLARLAVVLYSWSVRSLTPRPTQAFFANPILLFLCYFPAHLSSKRFGFFIKVRMAFQGRFKRSYLSGASTSKVYIWRYVCTSHMPLQWPVRMSDMLCGSIQKPAGSCWVWTGYGFRSLPALIALTPILPQRRLSLETGHSGCLWFTSPNAGSDTTEFCCASTLASWSARQLPADLLWPGT